MVGVLTGIFCICASGPVLFLWADSMCILQDSILCETPSDDSMLWTDWSDNIHRTNWTDNTLDQLD